jgi:3-methyladenine DNA glycosylase AlkD
MIKEILKQIKSKENPKNVEGMKRFGINTGEMYGLSTNELKEIAKKHKKNHELALELWDTEIYEARVIAFFIDDAEKVSEEQMEKWGRDFDNWATCDGCILHLFAQTKYAYKKAVQWARKKEEFIKRAGFVLMAVLAVHDKKAEDDKFQKFFPLIEKASDDERNFVKKAVNWALRQIGKRNINLHKEAIKLAEKIKQQDSKSAKWIANDALREFRSETTKRILERRKKTIAHR